MPEAVCPCSETSHRDGHDPKASSSNSVLSLAYRTLGRGISRFLPWFAAALVAVLLPVAASGQQTGDRVALIIGNSSYPDASTPLATTPRDARTLADEFRRVDFQVDLKENVNKEDMKRSIDAFMAKIKTGTEALFYFSGFGLQVDRRSYIIPVDAQIWSEADVRRDGISVDDVLAEMQRRGAKVKIIIVDASRRNPFERRFRASPAGLAPLGAPEGTLALFSAAPGTVISDRDSGASNSVLVTELIKELRSPNQTAEQAFNRTRIGVSRASNNEVVPWVASSLLEEFYFRPRQATVQPAPAPIPAPTPAPAPPPPAPAPPPPRRVTPAPPPPPPEPPPPSQVDRGGNQTPTEPEPEPQQRRTQTQTTTPSRVTPGQVFRDCGNCPEMVAVPAGTFTMGSKTDYASPPHNVTISKSFAIGRYEVTFAEWDRCVSEGGCKSKPSDRGWGRNRNPVINVSWLDAKEFAAWLSQKTGQKYRLPTEAEWEYAGRGNTRTTYWWGAEIGARRANCQDCNTGQPQKALPVGSFQPNSFGIYDTSGNVAEWVEDCWHPDYQGAPTDGSAWLGPQCQLRVLRGGAFDSSANYVSATSRFRYDYDVPYSANGFRLVRELP